MQHLPHGHHLLMTSFQTGAGQKYKQCKNRNSCKTSKRAVLQLSQMWLILFSFTVSPGHTVHSLLVDWRHNEADRGHHCLVSRAVQDLPLEGLGVVNECTLISFMDSNLKQNPGLRVINGREDMLRLTMEWSAGVLTSCCLKSHTAWMGSLPLMEVVGLRGFSWMMDLALLFKPATRVLNSFSCSFSSCWKQIKSNYIRIVVVHIKHEQKIPYTCFMISKLLVLLDNAHVLYM